MVLVRVDAAQRRRRVFSRARLVSWTEPAAGAVAARALAPALEPGEKQSLTRRDLYPVHGAQPLAQNGDARRVPRVLRERVPPHVHVPQLRAERQRGLELGEGLQAAVRQVRGIQLHQRAERLRVQKTTRADVQVRQRAGDGVERRLVETQRVGVARVSSVGVFFLVGRVKRPEVDARLQPRDLAKTVPVHVQLLEVHALPQALDARQAVVLQVQVRQARQPGEARHLRDFVVVQVEHANAGAHGADDFQLGRDAPAVQGDVREARQVRVHLFVQRASRTRTRDARHHHLARHVFSARLAILGFAQFAPPVERVVARDRGFFVPELDARGGVAHGVGRRGKRPSRAGGCTARRFVERVPKLGKNAWTFLSVSLSVEMNRKRSIP